MLAVTNHLTQNVAAIPFLWVLPLSLYLLSFILCFDSDRWYNRWLFTRLAAVAVPGIAIAISNEDVRGWVDGVGNNLPAFKNAISSVSNISDLKLALAFFSVTLFVLFMVCHGELARRRPAPRYLTSFVISWFPVGGADRRLAASVSSAPYFLNGLYDLPINRFADRLHAGLPALGMSAAKTPLNTSFLDEPYDNVARSGYHDCRARRYSSRCAWPLQSSAPRRF